ncbi:MAG: hypothetical protein KKA46_14990 [Proteobacteria bacterium]|nr:hypothetical protein [Pseudomonadota bacterium]
MKAKTCTEPVGPRQRYDQLLRQVGRASVLSLNQNPEELDLLTQARQELLALQETLAELRLFTPEVQVEIAGGMVQDIYLTNTSAIPVKVVVRDYDNLKVDPDGYRDAIWSLGLRRQS